VNRPVPDTASVPKMIHVVSEERLACAPIAEHVTKASPRLLTQSGLC
jgi:hypothetical protein